MLAIPFSSRAIEPGGEVMKSEGQKSEGQKSGNLNWFQMVARNLREKWNNAFKGKTSPSVKIQPVKVQPVAVQSARATPSTIGDQGVVSSSMTEDNTTAKEKTIIKQTEDTPSFFDPLKNALKRKPQPPVDRFAAGRELADFRGKEFKGLTSIEETILRPLVPLLPYGEESFSANELATYKKQIQDLVEAISIMKQIVEKFKPDSTVDELEKVFNRAIPNGKNAGLKKAGEEIIKELKKMSPDQDPESSTSSLNWALFKKDAGLLVVMLKEVKLKPEKVGEDGEGDDDDDYKGDTSIPELPPSSTLPSETTHSVGDQELEWDYSDLSHQEPTVSSVKTHKKHLDLEWDSSGDYGDLSHQEPAVSSVKTYKKYQDFIAQEAKIEMTKAQEETYNNLPKSVQSQIKTALKNALKSYVGKVDIYESLVKDPTFLKLLTAIKNDMPKQGKASAELYADYKLLVERAGKLAKGMQEILYATEKTGTVSSLDKLAAMKKTLQARIQHLLGRIQRFTDVKDISNDDLEELDQLEMQLKLCDQLEPEYKKAEQVVTPVTSSNSVSFDDLLDAAQEPEDQPEIPFEETPLAKRQQAEAAEGLAPLRDVQMEPIVSAKKSNLFRLFQSKPTSAPLPDDPAIKDLFEREELAVKQRKAAALAKTLSGPVVVDATPSHGNPESAQPATLSSPKSHPRR